MIYWENLCNNPSAIELIENHKNKIIWSSLSLNKNALPLLKDNLDKVDWFCLSSNPCAIELLEANKKKINWDELAENPEIFIDHYNYNYDLIKENFKELGEEIIHKSLHPKRMLRLMEEYGEDEIYSCYFDEN